ncbi:component of oligomeric golgi complex 1 [Guillardia theta CCMP2712]|uniref:Conserved oligomeric Golgi complex subunit 1 n=1 Tax=Guillardia theta (strain CCMP2712) TaxID=905079 RepID=L1JRC2_GUITC|nr:component of oligomeric golgi complex 1 [Guillardia theta CCMP2712]EKX51116.1 component of oligomeric golgi complex 1 [Guillardia theta CCMP2712]|eukprot:XP_005838096.1 component of oligomeric golgi complex 1 [Guillardia theta CCMP2712]
MPSEDSKDVMVNDNVDGNGGAGQAANGESGAHTPLNEESRKNNRNLSIQTSWKSDDSGVKSSGSAQRTGHFQDRTPSTVSSSSGARVVQLQSSTVADARHLLRKTKKDAIGKQEELRELVSVRYRDFIEAADTISAMGTRAREIIQVAGSLADTCGELMIGSWKAGRGQDDDSRAASAKDLLIILQAPERVATAIEQSKYLYASVQLLTARDSYRYSSPWLLKRSQEKSIKSWLAIPYVRLRIQSLTCKSQAEMVVKAAETALTSAHPSANINKSASLMGNAVAAIALVNQLSLRDSLDAYLEARTSAVKGLCRGISRERAGRDQGGDEELIEELSSLMGYACDAIARTVCDSLLLYCTLEIPTGGEGGEEEEAGKERKKLKEPIMLSYLKPIANASLHLRSDMLTELELPHCRTSALSWLRSMCATVRAAVSSALLCISSGSSLASLEAAVQDRANAAIESGEDAICWKMVTEESLWSMLYRSPFTTRSNQLVAARFSSIQVAHFLAEELQAISEEDMELVGAHSSTADLFQCRRPFLDHPPRGKAERREDRGRIWENRCNACSARFLTQLHSAVMDCKLLVGHQQDEGAQNASKDSSAEDERMHLLLKSSSEVKSLKELAEPRLEQQRKEVLRQERSGTMMSLGGSRAARDTRVEQSLYIAQCATGVEAHLSSILKLLPARNKSSEQEKMAEREQEERTSKLLSAASLGHGLWIEWIVANACTKFGLALQEVCGGDLDSVGAGDAVLQAPRSKIPGLPLLRDLKRMWEEVEISVETEGGETKTEKVAVPSSVLPHTFALLMDLSLELESLNVQMLFDFLVAKDLLAGHSLPRDFELRIQRVEEALEDRLDPIDWNFQKSLFQTNRIRAYQRYSVIFGAIVQLKRVHVRESSLQSGSLPKPINLLPLAQQQNRFGYLPAVDSWNLVEAEEEEEEEAKVKPAEPLSGGKASNAGVGIAGMDSLHKDVQASLGRFSSLMAKGWTNAADTLVGGIERRVVK